MPAPSCWGARVSTAMPVYEYLCHHCDHRFEQYRKPSERRLSKCPRCGRRARKTFRPVDIIFKGPGFHSTDYGKTGAESTRPEKQPAAADSPSPPHSKKDTADP